MKSARITKPSHVYDALQDATADEVLMVLYGSAQRVVQDRIRAYYQKYLPLAQEITEEQVAATGVKPGTPKFEKAFRTMVTTHLNARPKKIASAGVKVAVPPQPAPMEMGQGAHENKRPVHVAEPTWANIENVVVLRPTPLFARVSWT